MNETLPKQPVDDSADDASVALSPQRGWLRIALGETFVRVGARFGLVWIVLMVVVAVLAPLTANTHPFLIEDADGNTTSPILKHFTAVDYTLFLFGLAFIVLLVTRRLGVLLQPLGAGIAMGSALFVFVIATLIVDVPATVNFEQYRVAEANGEITRAIRTPIPYSPNDRLADKQGRVLPEAPSKSHWIGTEGNGADLASRMIHATRVALAIGFISTGIAVIIGVIVGALMGYFSGIVDLLGMRLLEILQAIPTLFLLLIFVAFFPGDELEFGRLRVQRIFFIMAIIGLTSWPGYARFIRAEFLKLRKQDFVVAARACGLPIRSILFRHMLPNGIAPVLVSASFGVASAILAESTLSFLGLGLNEDPSWGQLLKQATASSGFDWWLAIFPGLAIFLTVFAYTLIGESLRDAIDPHLKKAANI